MHRHHGLAMMRETWGPVLVAACITALLWPGLVLSFYLQCLSKTVADTSVLHVR